MFREVQNGYCNKERVRTTFNNLFVKFRRDCAIKNALYSLQMSKIWSINERSEEQVRKTDKFGEQHEGNMEGRGKFNPFDHFEGVQSILFCTSPPELDENVVMDG